MAKPCIHGEVCREYLRQRRGIICQTCPNGCRFYKPKDRGSKHQGGILLEMDPVEGWRPAK